jgi:TonB family protein
MTLRISFAYALTLFVGIVVATSPCQTQSESTPVLHLSRFVAPAYPAAARMARIQGKAQAGLQISADGTVASVIVKSHPLFQRYVEEALKQWRFEPLTEPASLHVEVNFEIESCDHMHIKPEPLGSAQVRETRVSADLPGTVNVSTCADFIITSNSDAVSR